MTGSETLLRILHGLGHTASIATVHRHDTALALVSSYSVEKELPIPQNMSRKQFTTLVWDNNDFSEETISGKGTTHVANGIILQNASFGCTLGEKTTVSKKERTIKPPEINIVPYYSKEKISPMMQNEAADVYLEEHIHHDDQIAGRNADFLYNIIKKNASENGENLPGWTGLNTQIHRDVRDKTIIGYLPVIDSPVTDLSTVNALLQCSMSIAERLDVPEIVLVFDEAIYAKAQMIRWKHDAFRKRLVIRLGDFHTVMSYCSAISKIYKDAGLQVSFTPTAHNTILVE
jgi:hypothetical protein